jgi:Predicted transmembrane transcriptional regulator (anti-sigma factor)
MPDLSDDGFVFLGGRLLPAPAIPGGRAAQLMYEHASGGRLTLYVTPAAGVDGPQAEWVRRGDDNALFWSNGQITCTIVGAQPVETIETLAQTVFAQLTPATTTPRYREL